MDNLIFYCLVTMAFIIMHGVDCALIMKTTLANGRKAGQITACGIAIGCIFHTTAAILGLSAIIAKSAFLFDMVKYIGAAYLFYLGIMSFRTSAIQATSDKDVIINTQPAENKNLRGFLLQGILCNVLNPKTILFYLTFLPQFVIQSEPVMPQLFTLGVILMILALAWFIFLAYALGYIRKYFDNPIFKSRMQKTTGILLISFGLKLALDKK
ncbi:LysE family translocator [Anaerosinus massiliensis]|uniref:LysE family translocator n=1 Tax=Massilibacillus massiliensis TaxID=1806837 RepID=UPI000ABCB163|nr:LysE family translocator [Massilibacillus massiliensis]